MNKSLSWKILLPLGIILFIFGGGVYGDIGIIGLICFVSGILSLIFPKQLEKFNIIKSRENILSIVVFVVVFLLALIYIWWKLYS
jgi:membrane-bound ClpP family serine protease